MNLETSTFKLFKVLKVLPSSIRRRFLLDVSMNYQFLWTNGFTLSSFSYFRLSNRDDACSVNVLLKKSMSIDRQRNKLEYTRTAWGAAAVIDGTLLISIFYSCKAELLLMMIVALRSKSVKSFFSVLARARAIRQSSSSSGSQFVEGILLDSILEMSIYMCILIHSCTHKSTHKCIINTHTN